MFNGGTDSEGSSIVVFKFYTMVTRYRDMISGMNLLTVPMSVLGPVLAPPPLSSLLISFPSLLLLLSLVELVAALSENISLS